LSPAAAAAIGPANGAEELLRDEPIFMVSTPYSEAAPERPPLVLGLELRPFMQIIVRDNNVDQALRALKKKLQREGVYREMKLRRHYEKPSEKRARERAAAVRRARKLERKRMERDGGPR
jgi:small subunit ribosomal protein S21